MAKTRTTVTYTAETNKTATLQQLWSPHITRMAPARQEGRSTRPATKRTTVVTAVAVQRRNLEHRMHSQGESIKFDNARFRGQ